MIIEKDTKMRIHHNTRGEFVAKARRSFSLDDDAYPLTVVDPMNARCVRGEEIQARASATILELLTDCVNETETELQIETEDALNPEMYFETQTQPIPESPKEYSGGNICGLGMIQ